MRSITRKVAALVVVSGLVIGVAGVAGADKLVSDTDSVMVGDQAHMTLNATPGQVQNISVSLVIECTSSKSHMAGTTTISMAPIESGGSTKPTGGTLSASSVQIAKPAGWPADDTSCPESPLRTAPQSSTVTVGAPAATGVHTYKIEWVSSDDDVKSNGGSVTIDVTVAAASSDTTDPTITLTTPAAGAVYKLNQPVTAAYSCSDNVAVATCDGTVANGAAIDTSSLGTKSFVVDATDTTGNTAQATHSYTVQANSSVFGQPVDNGNVLNKAKAGRAIPLKWRLTDYYGDPISNVANSAVKVTVANVACSLAGSTDLLEEYSADGSGLQNLGDGYYQWDWKSPTSYANSCKTLTVGLPGGGGATALFNFTK